MEGEKVEEVDVGFVKQGDFPVLEIGAEGRGAGVVVVGSLLNDGAGGQETLEVEIQVQLGRSFPATVFCPIHTICQQRDGGGVDGMYGLFEPAWQTFVADAEAAGQGVFEVVEGFPEEFLFSSSMTWKLRASHPGSGG